MSEHEPLDIKIEDEKQPLDRQLRILASQLGFVETPKIYNVLAETRNGKDMHKPIDKYSDELERVRKENKSPDFLVAAALTEAAAHLHAGNIKEAYNNLAAAADILDFEQTHPEILAKIDAMMATL